MSSDRPRVTLGMPLYNAQRFLAQTLESILAQTFSDFEVVISDNGSTDKTQEICAQYAAGERRIRYYRNETNRGAAWNHNRVVELAQAEYFKWACYDDPLAPEFLEKCVAVLDRDPSVVVCYTKVMDIDDDGNCMEIKESKTSKEETPSARFRTLIYNGHTCEEIYGVMRSEVLRKTPLIGAYTYSDQNLLAELALHGGFHEVPEVLFFHRWHSASTYRLWPNNSDRWLWFDPAAAGRVVFPFWRQLAEFVSTVRRSSIGSAERARCYRHIARWIRQCRKGLWGDAYWGTRALAIQFLKARMPWLRTAYQGLGASEERR